MPLPEELLNDPDGLRRAVEESTEETIRVMLEEAGEPALKALLGALSKEQLEKVIRAATPDQVENLQKAEEAITQDFQEALRRGTQPSRHAAREQQYGKYALKHFIVSEAQRAECEQDEADGWVWEPEELKQDGWTETKTADGEPAWQPPRSS